MHGHSYRLDVTVRGPIRSRGPARGMVEDFETIERIVRQRVLDALDHRNLNDVVENPTVESVARWIWRQLKKHVRGLDEVVLWETRTSCAILRKGD